VGSRDDKDEGVAVRCGVVWRRGSADAGVVDETVCRVVTE
jgi:hypothetical protein